MSNHISIVRGTSLSVQIPIVDQFGDPLDVSLLQGATATFTLKSDPADVVIILQFVSTVNPASLSIEKDAPFVDLNLVPGDTIALAIATYFYQVQVTLTTGVVLPVVTWTLFDVNLGGAGATPTPPFDNTVKVDHNYPLSNDLAYMTPGGSPIVNAQIRLYFKSDYVAGNLASPVGITTTNAFGQWSNPILVKPGFEYIVRFEQPGAWGPDTAEITA